MTTGDVRTMSARSLGATRRAPTRCRLVCIYYPDLNAPDEVVDGGPERVIVVWHVSGTASKSRPTTRPVHDPRGQRGREYVTKDEALAAVADEG